MDLIHEISEKKIYETSLVHEASEKVFAITGRTDQKIAEIMAAYPDHPDVIALAKLLEK